MYPNLSNLDGARRGHAGPTAPPLLPKKSATRYRTTVKLPSHSLDGHRRCSSIGVSRRDWRGPRVLHSAAESLEPLAEIHRDF